jgi:hypothetical protein
MTWVVMFICNRTVSSCCYPQAGKFDVFYRPEKDKAALIYKINGFIRRRQA